MKIRWLIVLFVLLCILACGIEHCTWERTCTSPSGEVYTIGGTGTSCGYCRDDSTNGACTVECSGE